MTPPLTSFNGIGEPLLDKKLPDRIALARARGIPETAMASNGLLLEPRLARELIRAGLTRAVIALDGLDPASQDSGHQGADPERVAEHLEGLLAAKRELAAEHLEVLIRVTVQRGNLAALAAIYRRWWGRVTHIQLNLVYQYGQARTDPLIPVPWHPPFPCPQTRDSLLVLTNGDATLCCLGDINAELAPGNLARDSLEHCFSGPPRPGNTATAPGRRPLHPARLPALRRRHPGQFPKRRPGPRPGSGMRGAGGTGAGRKMTEPHTGRRRLAAEARRGVCSAAGCPRWPVSTRGTMPPIPGYTSRNLSR